MKIEKPTCLRWTTWDAVKKGRERLQFVTELWGQIKMDLDPSSTNRDPVMTAWLWFSSKEAIQEALSFFLLSVPFLLCSKRKGSSLGWGSALSAQVLCFTICRILCWHSVLWQMQLITAENVFTVQLLDSPRVADCLSYTGGFAVRSHPRVLICAQLGHGTFSTTVVPFVLWLFLSSA